MCQRRYFATLFSLLLCSADLKARYPYVPFIPARDTNIATKAASTADGYSVIPVPNPEVAKPGSEGWTDNTYGASAWGF